MLDLLDRPLEKAGVPKRVKMQRVKSSNVHSIGLDELRNRMYIQFNNGSIYMYKNAGKREFNQMRIASSKGQWFWRHMRQKVGKYPYEQIKSPVRKGAEMAYRRFERSRHDSIGRRRRFERRRGPDFDEALEELERVLPILEDERKDGEKLENELDDWHRMSEREQDRLIQQINYWMESNGDEVGWIKFFNDMEEAYKEEAGYLDMDELERAEKLMREYEEEMSFLFRVIMFFQEEYEEIFEEYYSRGRR